jgi:hypothetical protein
VAHYFERPGPPFASPLEQYTTNNMSANSAAKKKQWVDEVDDDEVPVKGQVSFARFLDFRLFFYSSVTSFCRARLLRRRLPRHTSFAVEFRRESFREGICLPLAMATQRTTRTSRQ